MVWKQKTEKVKIVTQNIFGWEKRVSCVILNVKRQGKDTESFVKGKKECG